MRRSRLTATALRVLSSKHTTVAVGASIGGAQLTLFAVVIARLLAWHGACLDACVTAAQGWRCLLWAHVPGLVLIPLVAAWMLWPPFVLVTNLDIAFMTPSDDDWPHKPAYFDAITCAQLALADAVLLREHMARRTLAMQSLSQVRRAHPRAALPLEIRLIVLDCLDRDLAQERAEVAAALAYSGWVGCVEDGELFLWLRLIALVGSWRLELSPMPPYTAITVAWPFGNRAADTTRASRAASPVSPQPPVKQRLWLAMFSKDMAVLTLNVMLRVSIFTLMALKRSRASTPRE
ncbi:hypothetical protein HK105_203273 [Polyrhizophydium stewartii]|uniref:Uncharacterized protein n=1 Tax=Polyrhizophydium stewartii TaxID=2732419 RepID=A0ABR4NCI2_9FUNG|nr:hypothetical protein HK105_000070 [Polyrhizophydium stewartii]